MDIADRIREMRLERGWTQEELAGKLDTEAPVIASWESGRRTPNAENLVRLANALGMSADWLLGLA
jgi:transcriptional regulator with XRE-family HTH domain